MAEIEQERLWLSMAEKHLEQLDREIKMSQRRLEELNKAGYFADEKTFEEAFASVVDAHAQMRAHRSQVSNRLEELGRPPAAHPRDARSSFAYRSAKNVRRT